MNTQLPDKAHIAVCTDEAVLNRWHGEAYDIFDEVRSRIEAFRLAGTATDDWLQRSAKLVALCHIIMRKVERRLIEMGLTVPATRSGYYRDQVQQLRGRVRSLERELRDLQEPVDA